MKSHIKKLLPVWILLLIIGCDMQFPGSDLPSVPPADKAEPYVADKLHIMGLTEIVSSQNDSESAVLKIYVDLLDSFDCRIKSPGVFRFELYEFVPRSSDPRGKRLFFQPDLDLTDAAENHKYWQDHLRTYRFDLPLELVPAPGSTFILEATFMPPGGKRLNNKFQLKYQ